MFIQTEPTPNPAALKFIPGVTVMESGSADFTNADDAARSPLASGLFAIEGVVGVYLGADFISVTKVSDREWFIMKPSILGAIVEHFASGRPVISDDVTATDSDETYDAETAEVVSQIRELLDTRVRPAVAQDGGDIVFKRFDGGVVWLHMQGACAGCPSSTATLKSGIENMLRHYIPEVSEVRAVDI